MWINILEATLETLEMVAISGLITFLIGLPLGIYLYATRRGNLVENLPVYYLLGSLVNALRSVPFIILMLALIPVTKFIVGTSIGLYASLVPLSIAAIPFYARLVESAMNEVPKGLLEAAQAMGGTRLQITRKVLISEAMPGLVSGLTLTLVNLVGYSAMAGAIGAGGLGKLAYHYGVNRFDTFVMISTVVIMIFIVQGIQSMGDYVVHKILSR